MRSLQPELERRRTAHLYRRRRVLNSPQGPLLNIDGRELLSFCSNDYLGLANHPQVIEALQRGARQYGAGSGSAHLISGHSTAHHALEEELAEFTGRERALLYSTGYMANQGVIAALLGRDDTIYQDRLNHASLIDGGVLARARLKRFRHNDVAHLEQQMTGQQSGEVMVAVDGVFSMDGDLAPLSALARCCARQDAWLLVDDAHGLGVLGRDGRGSVDHCGLGQREVPVLMGTLGKALGSFGAFVAGSEALIETLIQQSRSYIYTTALPPAVAEATRASLRLVQTGGERREHLQELIAFFRAEVAGLGLSLMESPTPIQPILAGSAAQALVWSQALEAQGILVSAIRPPTVSQGSARLRITLSASHSRAQLERLLQALAGLPWEEAR